VRLAQPLIRAASEQCAAGQPSGYRRLPTGSMIASSDAGTSSQKGQKKTPRSSHMAAHTAQNTTHSERQSRPPEGRFSGIAITPVTTTLRRQPSYH
jgi:hypothetical protein